ncbi:HAD family hydrolase [Phytoactinopolyspora mesophila]|uniref:HAD hydrolase-like protein n=1 Tax=Phytoactinopolyspora mesophila TaxID=2650750 RepID=A0A7K3M0N9_9ACTN|nr:HAD family hydrolase [Phytoactinopolyspora mesophila]NDL56856.1 HAD hydrolase-like protein [Phytoactinopolyspora mesophila]
MKKNLIFDADDTLWENNVLFEKATDAFIDFLAHPSLARDEIRHRLEEIERANVPRYGYGVDAFQRSLTDCLTALRPGEPPSAADLATLGTVCDPIRAHAVELIEGVVETLQELSTRHQLFLLTKGDHTHQAAKIEASGLADLFADAVVVPEKETAVYHGFVSERSLDATDTWMIGNSPKSDIQPALQAGLGAVLVPHPMTWALEFADVPRTHERFREVTPFTALVEYF